ncbi:hypothetical protein CU098_009390 [Rhizopus stolonifer]|uniref:Cation-transporting P-type ATPase N-terminal domain-containing protein n=1 Tax=Rhizopus stolonifer TaxID=4846 RepID=A0A367KS74_RHIST|nr:hypothetical protein CU098_009390 [Rhizopus stolonifer]
MLFKQSKPPLESGPPTIWHTKSIEQVVQELNTSIEIGLTEQEAVERQSTYGFNELDSGDEATWIKILLHQFLDIMNWIFIALGIVSMVLGDYITGSLIIVVAIFNFYLTFQQEYAAEQTMAALKSLSSPTANVIRDGKEQTIASNALVPGDLLLIKEGDSVAADARLIHLSNLEADEALLTGESVPVQKKLIVLEKEDEPLGDRRNMVYSSTIIAKGRGQAIVTSIGMKTEIVIIVLASVKFHADRDIGMYAMTSALSVLPAGLTTVLTITLVMGGKEMTKQRAIVRKLKVLETLGSITHIFSDKTGTLTMAKMVVVRFWTPQEGYFYLTPNGLAPQGNIYRTHDELIDNPLSSEKTELIDKPQLLMSSETKHFIECAALCNMSSIHRREDTENTITRHESLSKMTSRHSNVVIEMPQAEEEKDNSESDNWIPSGAPTEVALQVFAHKFNKGKPQLIAEDGWEMIQEYQFDSTIKRMSTVWYNRPQDHTFVFTKGATERILPLCINMPTQESHIEVMNHLNVLASKGLRVIAMAYRKEESNMFEKDRDRSIIEKDLIFLGLAGIYDPPRAESLQAVKEAHQAGISVHMLTGDHAITATAIAKELNILNEKTMSPEVLKELVMTGPQFDAMTEEEVDALPHLPFVVARCSPETKVKMIVASKRRNYIAAMTGDGVNDSPSLRIANVGISMGKNGSDVAKQSSDIILTDDNFATIIRAIAEGRKIYQNVQRFLLYFWIALLGLWLVLILALAIRDPNNKSAAPISTIQMLFLYVAFTPPAGVLSFQPASKTVMKEPPRSPKESLFNREIVMDLFVYSLGFAAFSFIAFIIPLYTRGHHGIEGSACEVNFDYAACESFFRGRGVLLAFMTLGTLVVMVHCRSYREIEWGPRGLKETFKSKTVIYTLSFDIVCLMIFYYVPTVAEKGFYMLGFSWEWAIVVGLLIVYAIFGEFYKLLKRKFMKPVKPHQLSKYIAVE